VNATVSDSKISTVHQFHSGTAVGDAITQQMIFLRSRLRALGFKSEIFAQHIPDELAGDIRNIATWKPEDSAVDTLLLVHHSMGYTAFDDVLGLEVDKVTIFHSITPARFFEDATLRRFIRVGIDQLHELARRSLFGIADSNHNRQEMYRAGFATVDVLPVRTHFDQFRSLAAAANGVDWLFVGRIVPNKRQVEIVEAFGRWVRTFNVDARLHLVGDTSYTPYLNEVLAAQQRVGVEDRVVIHGKVAESRLLEIYGGCGLFVCLSEHEGFGVPLLEAMASRLPVIAFDAAAVAETMGGAGVLVDSLDSALVASVAELLRTDPGLRERIVEHQSQRLARIESFAVDRLLADIVHRARATRRGTTVQIVGPFETSYSLATLNRELALALDQHSDLDVSLYATEGPGDYVPRDDDLARVPEATMLFRKSIHQSFPDVAIRQMFPPRVSDSAAGLTLQYFGWEESGVPHEYCTDFNRFVDGIGVMSHFVADALRESGVDVPISVVGVGVHPPAPTTTDPLPHELEGLRSFRFLHISSAFPRKGVDVLLRAYFEAFTAADDVSLILKTFPNPHNQVSDLIEELRATYPHPPDLRWIDRDVDREVLDGLYGIADAYVHAARGEGFGLPVAEAMLARVPVISVASTGLADFVSADTAAVISHIETHAETHLSTEGSVWMEPSRDDLVRELRAAASGLDPATRSRRVEKAERLIATEFTWERVAVRWRAFIDELSANRHGHQVAMVSTFNSRCGIAEYTAELIDAMGPSERFTLLADRDAEAIDSVVEETVQRVWRNHLQGTADDLLVALDASSADIVHIQHNFGFFEFAELGRIIHHEVARRPVVVTLHRTADHYDDGQVAITLDVAIEQLRLADAIIVHQREDVARLASVGISSNVHCVPIGAAVVPDATIVDARRRNGLDPNGFVIGTFGFLLPHKGTVTMLRAVGELRRRGVDARALVVSAIHPDPSSSAYLATCKAEVERFGLQPFVRFVTDFIPPNAARDLLAATDVVVLPYEPTNESSSAALRFLLPIGRPIVTSELPIFGDAADAVLQTPVPVTAISLADTLQTLWADPTARHQAATRVRSYARATSIRRTAAATRQIYDRITQSRRHNSATTTT
jgi:glycosyltransferase involved in cell wall biosynthesis